ncbi:ATP phosphoribosyltransferase [Ferrithrix thermotolerans DSM 19514]|uniref:ATP phosphoribosyltransferase n=1 Tax=Ferrithrix thermotolerans DSM 19514 TaxID=1121881 RepID=A0A1M4S6E5_9ACTN|nr:ATP phosphoribosyltransferase [Ferrithrix thermotolerans]SHE27745.1 ATP phosphoribosyltransferase [Ferrithrix thermotolerans DSM 19514]
MLKLVLPKGSLEKATLELFSAADLGVERSSDVDYRATVDDPRISEVRILRPQEIPTYVEAGLFDFGITGRDWIEETGADVVSLGELQYSKATTRPIKLVLAVPAESHVKTPSDLRDGVRVSTEYPSITKRYFKDLGVEVEVVFSYGATEAKVPDIADAVVEITETGKALRAAGLSIIDTILVSHTEVIANKDVVSDPLKLHAIEQLMTLLQGTLAARSKVLVKLNVAEEDLDVVIGLLPSMKAPTISKLYGDLGYAVEAVVPRHTINTLIPALKDHGASDILEIPLSKIVP